MDFLLSLLQGSCCRPTLGGRSQHRRRFAFSRYSEMNGRPRPDWSERLTSVLSGLVLKVCVVSAGLVPLTPLLCPSCSDFIRKALVFLRIVIWDRKLASSTSAMIYVG